MSTRPPFERRPAKLSAFAQLRLNVYMTVLNVVLSPILHVWNIGASKKTQQAISGVSPSLASRANQFFLKRRQALWLSMMGLLFSIAVVLRSIELGNSALLTVSLV
jgi:hypothetical protein